jgi:competence protein ComGC
MRHNKKLAAFTIVEILIVAPIVILVIGVFIGAIVSMTGDVLASRGANVMASNIQDTLSRIKQDVNLSGSFLATNNITVTSPQGYNNDATAFHNADSTNGTMLILNAYATTNNPLSSIQNIIYANSPNLCSSAQVSLNQPLTMNIVYFVKNNTLWRRVIMPSNYTTIGCSLPWQQPSCAPGITGTNCKAQDIDLVDGMSSSGFSISYYSNPSSVVPDSVASDSGQSDANRQIALNSDNTVGVTITATQNAAGRVVSQTGTVRANGQNNNAVAGVVTSGMILNLDAGSSISYPGSGTTWYDLSGSGNDGTLVNGVSYSGNNGGALSFNGTNNYISKNSSINTGNNFSVFAWVNPQTATNGRNVVVNNSYPYSTDQGWLLCFQLDNSFFLSIGSDNAYGQSASGVITNGRWNYIGATTTNGGASFNLYLNGNPTPVVSGVSSARSISYTNNTFYIGDRSTEFYKGQISNVSIYNRTLNVAEVQQNFNANRDRYGI